MIYLSGVVRPDMPAMLQPGIGNVPPAGQAWAADNGRYAKPATYSDAGYLAWLELRLPHRERCLFATAPDVVGVARETLELSGPMWGPIAELGYTPALVAQDGLELEVVPWSSFGALFIGGTDAWRHTDAVRQLAGEAKARGKWLHLGRVSSRRRLAFAKTLGCDSVDGTYLRFGDRPRARDARRGRDVGKAELQRWLEEVEAQTVLDMRG